MEDCANPILLGFVLEWLETARERNSKGVTVYKKAYESLKRCPIVFQHPSEAKQLTGFGDKLCQRLTDKMEEYCEANGLPKPERRRKRSRAAANNAGENDDDEPEAEPAPAPKKSRAKAPYVPRLRSGGYAIVMALAARGENAPAIMKEEIIRLAQPYSDKSFTAPSTANAFFTAWNSMKTLVDKELVHERGRPKRYSLLEEGWEVARRMQSAKTIEGDPSNPCPTKSRGGASSVENSPTKDRRRDIDRNNTPPTQPGFVDIPQGDIITSQAALPKFTPITIPPQSFTVELVLDTREIRAKQDRDYVQNNLANKGVTPIMRSLPLGDITWVAKIHDINLKQRIGDEILLDYIVERKRMDDLVGSIKDGRFKDQKFRLGKSGVKHVIYIIEEFSMNADHFAKYEEAVQSAIASMQVVNGYFVKRTQIMDDTISYLVSMTKFLKQKYKDKSLKLVPTEVVTAQNYLPLLDHLSKEDPSAEYHITYPAFAALSSKSESLTLRDIYLKMLMCTRGVTGEKALEIQKRWKTPIEFHEAYKSCEGSGRTADESRKRKWELVSSHMGQLVGRKKIQKTLSGRISEVWGNVGT